MDTVHQQIIQKKWAELVVVVAQMRSTEFMPLSLNMNIHIFHPDNFLLRFISGIFFILYKEFYQQ